MSESNLSGPLFVAGVPITGYGIPASFGDVFFVDSDVGNDGYDGKSMKQAKKTVLAGYNLLTTNKDDVLVISGKNSHALTVQLTVAKNRVHFIGLGLGHRYFGQPTKINLPVSTGAGIAAISVTGVRCTFSNLKITSNDTLSTSLYGVADGGEFTQWNYCEFLKTTDLDQTGAAELLCTGDSVYYNHCTFGNGIYTVAAARQNVLMTRSLSPSSNVARDVIFEDCLFMSRCNSATFVNIRATSNDVERLFLFKNCTFVAVKTSPATQALVFGVASALTDSEAILQDCLVQNITNVGANTIGVFTNSPTPVANATETVAVHTS